LRAPSFDRAAQVRERIFAPLDSL